MHESIDPFLQKHLYALQDAIHAERHQPAPPPCFPTGIIGLSGPAGVGKDTTGELLRVYLSRYGSVYVTSFAEPLYAMVSAMTGISVEKLKDRKTKESLIAWEGAPRHMEGWTVRRLLQFFGTEVVRTHLGYDYWVHRLLDRVAERRPTIVIITDVRFENEKSICDWVVELERTGFSYPNDHASAQRIPADQTFNLDNPDFYTLARMVRDALAS